MAKKKKVSKKKEAKKKESKKKDQKKKESLKKTAGKKKLKKKKAKKKDLKKKEAKKKKGQQQKAVSPPAAFNDRSSNYNVREAIKKLRSLENAEQVKAFTFNEKRVTIKKVVPGVLRRLAG